MKNRTPVQACLITPKIRDAIPPCPGLILRNQAWVGPWPCPLLSAALCYCWSCEYWGHSAKWFQSTFRSGEWLSICQPMRDKKWIQYNSGRSNDVKVLIFHFVNSWPIFIDRSPIVVSVHRYTQTHIWCVAPRFYFGAQPLTGRQCEHTKQKLASLNSSLSRSCGVGRREQTNQSLSSGWVYCGPRGLLCKVCPQLPSSSIFTHLYVR